MLFHNRHTGSEYALSSLALLQRYRLAASSEKLRVNCSAPSIQQTRDLALTSARTATSLFTSLCKRGLEGLNRVSEHGPKGFNLYHAESATL